MANPQKLKGDRAERECAEILQHLLGLPAQRLLGAGRKEDVGDIHGIPGHVIQVADWKDVLAALRMKPLGAQRQAVNAGAFYSSTFLRLKGGAWRVAMTPREWARLAVLTLPPELAANARLTTLQDIKED
jgi:Holliday junction resolvase